MRMTGRLRSLKKEEVVAPGMETGNFLELFFLKYFSSYVPGCVMGRYMFKVGRFLGLNIPGILMALLGSVGKGEVPRQHCRDHVPLKHNV